MNRTDEIARKYEEYTNIVRQTGLTEILQLVNDKPTRVFKDIETGYCGFIDDMEIMEQINNLPDEGGQIDLIPTIICENPEEVPDSFVEKIVEIYDKQFQIPLCLMPIRYKVKGEEESVKVIVAENELYAFDEEKGEWVELKVIEPSEEELYEQGII